MSFSNCHHQTNPLQEDAVLASLLKKLSKVGTECDFDDWRDSFLARFVEFLDEDGIEKAESTYWEFADAMSSFVRVINKLTNMMDQGLISAQKCPVKARQCLQNFNREITVIVEKVESLVPGTMSLERRVGYTKFHMGAVLLRDGFREYGRMSLSADVIEQLIVHLDGIADKLILVNMNYYIQKLQSFCDVMADLGLFKAMLKCRDFVYADDDEERINLSTSDLLDFKANMMNHASHYHAEISSLAECSTDAEKPLGTEEPDVVKKSVSAAVSIKLDTGLGKPCQPMEACPMLALAVDDVEETSLMESVFLTKIANVIPTSDTKATPETNEHVVIEALPDNVASKHNIRQIKSSIPEELYPSLNVDEARLDTKDASAYPALNFPSAKCELHQKARETESSTYPSLHPASATLNIHQSQEFSAQSTPVVTDSAKMGQSQAFGERNPAPYAFTATIPLSSERKEQGFEKMRSKERATQPSYPSFEPAFAKCGNRHSHGPNLKSPPVVTKSSKMRQSPVSKEREPAPHAYVAVNPSTAEHKPQESERLHSGASATQTPYPSFEPAFAKSGTHQSHDPTPKSPPAVFKASTMRQSPILKERVPAPYAYAPVDSSTIKHKSQEFEQFHPEACATQSSYPSFNPTFAKWGASQSQDSSPKPPLKVTETSTKSKLPVFKVREPAPYAFVASSYPAGDSTSRPSQCTPMADSVAEESARTSQFDHSSKAPLMTAHKSSGRVRWNAKDYYNGAENGKNSKSQNGDRTHSHKKMEEIAGGGKLKHLSEPFIEKALPQVHSPGPSAEADSTKLKQRNEMTRSHKNSEDSFKPVSPNGEHATHFPSTVKNQTCHPSELLEEFEAVTNVPRYETGDGTISNAHETKIDEAKMPEDDLLIRRRRKWSLKDFYKDTKRTIARTVKDRARRLPKQSSKKPKEKASETNMKASKSNSSFIMKETSNKSTGLEPARSDSGYEAAEPGARHLEDSESAASDSESGEIKSNLLAEAEVLDVGESKFRVSKAVEPIAEAQKVERKSDDSTGPSSSKRRDQVQRGRPELNPIPPKGVLPVDDKAVCMPKGDVSRGSRANGDSHLKTTPSQIQSRPSLGSENNCVQAAHEGNSTVPSKPNNMNGGDKVRSELIDNVDGDKKRQEQEFLRSKEETELACKPNLPEESNTMINSSQSAYSEKPIYVVSSALPSKNGSFKKEPDKFSSQSRAEKEQISRAEESKRNSSSAAAMIKTNPADELGDLKGLKASVYSENDAKNDKSVSEELRRKCYMWYIRMGCPPRDNMKRRVANMHETCDITVDEVDELPWISNGEMLSAMALGKLINSDVTGKPLSEKSNDRVKTFDITSYEGGNQPKALPNFPMKRAEDADKPDSHEKCNGPTENQDKEEQYSNNGDRLQSEPTDGEAGNKGQPLQTPRKKKKANATGVSCLPEKFLKVSNAFQVNNIGDKQRSQPNGDEVGGNNMQSTPGEKEETFAGKSGSLKLNYAEKCKNNDQGKNNGDKERPEGTDSEGCDNGQSPTSPMKIMERVAEKPGLPEKYHEHTEKAGHRIHSKQRSKPAVCKNAAKGQLLPTLPKSKAEKSAIKHNKLKKINDQELGPADKKLTIDNNDQTDQRTISKPASSSKSAIKKEKLHDAKVAMKEKPPRNENDKIKSAPEESEGNFSAVDAKNEARSVVHPVGLNKEAAASDNQVGSAKARAISKNNTKEKVVDLELRRKCYMWYARMGCPTRDTMKRRVAKLHATCDITVEDVDELPWICGGNMLSAPALSEMIIGNVAK